MGLMQARKSKFFFLQYQTKNQRNAHKAVPGKIANSLLIELRSIYDLKETREALGL